MHRTEKRKDQPVHIMCTQCEGATTNSLQTQAGGECKEKRQSGEGVCVSKNEVSNHNVPLVDSENNRLSQANF